MEERQNSLIEAITQYDNKVANLEQTARYVMGMPPADAVAIMDQYDVKNLVDLLRTSDAALPARGRGVFGGLLALHYARQEPGSGDPETDGRKTRIELGRLGVLKGELMAKAQTAMPAIASKGNQPPTLRAGARLKSAKLEKLTSSNSSAVPVSSRKRSSSRRTTIKKGGKTGVLLRAKVRNRHRILPGGIGRPLMLPKGSEAMSGR